MIKNQGKEFTISDIERECPDVSRVMIKLVLDKLKKEKKIKSLGKGKNARWQSLV